MTKRGDKEAILANVPLLAGLEAAERRALAGRCALSEVAAGHLVVREGDTGTALFVVSRGRVKIETHSRGADPVILEILGPGEIFGELSLLARRPRAADVIALEDCEFLSIDYRDLRATLERCPTVAIALLENLAQRIIGFGELVRSFAAASLEARLARRICALANAHGVRGDREVILDLSLTQRDWAHMAGASRETINRQFRVWSERGWIAIEGGKIRVQKLSVIRELATHAGLITV